MQRRSLLTLVLVLTVASSLAVLAVDAHRHTDIGVELDVTGYTVANESLTGVNLTATNHEPEAKAVLVRVWGLKDHRQHMWAAPDGQQRFHIAPGETRHLDVQRQQFNLSTAPSNPVLVAIATPDGVERTHTIIYPRHNESAT